MVKTTPVFEAHTKGQSIWLDNISRELLLSGELRRWVAEEGIRGVTSNPAIFEKAIAKSTDYDASTRALVAQGASDALDIFEKLAVTDIQLGCDVLRPVFDESGGRDGFVSLEVSPYLANDTEGTIAEARRLAKAVSRDNLMIKVPATPEGIPAIQQLIDDGIHVNVTLLFAIDAYEAVHQAYIAGLEARAARGDSVSGIASVASFFISRIDASVAQQIDAALEKETSEDRKQRFEALNAKIAIANAQMAYASFLETLGGERWKKLEAAGADPQRVLWASTGTKDPSLPKALYVDELIGNHTVNTLPDATLAAFREEGQVRDALGTDPAALKAGAQPILSELEALGISLKEITDTLLTKGCESFSEAFDGLLLSVETKRQQLIGNDLPSAAFALGEAASDVDAAALSWQKEAKMRKLWNRRAEIFSDADEASWMGWLDLPAAAPQDAIGPVALREAIAAHRAKTVLVVGMGGSSLWPAVLAATYSCEARSADPALGAAAGSPQRTARDLIVLDTTSPDAVARTLAEVDLRECLIFVSSKSGSTIEPNAVAETLFAKLAGEVGPDLAGRHFVAITDPGSALEARATQLGFLGVALGRPDVGGRFSALSPFGLLPAEAMGLDAEALLARARRMSAACAPFVSPERNPGVALGLALGTLARQGRDKLTLTAADGLARFPAWVEQLVAESTGKNGKGLIPIIGETLPAPASAGPDRVFVHVGLTGDASAAETESKLAALEAAGHPVIRFELASALDLVQEVFRWEIATSVVGALHDLNPFDQPDVEAAKIKSREFMAAGGDPAGAAHGETLEAGGLKLVAAEALAGAVRGKTEPADWIRALLGEMREGDAFLINVFLDENDALEQALGEIRDALRSSRANATSLSFGPRYLHSSGQLQKGGPDRICGLHLWQSAASRSAKPLDIPELGGSFDTLIEAQAAGDFAVLGERGRRMLGLDVGTDPAGALRQLGAWIREALA